MCLKIEKDLVSLSSIGEYNSKQYEWKLVFQKNSSRGVFRKRYSENVQQGSPMPTCDFIKVGKQLYWNYTSPLIFFCKFAAYLLQRFPHKRYYPTIFKIQNIPRELENSAFFNSSSFREIMNMIPTKRLPKDQASLFNYTCMTF